MRTKVLGLAASLCSVVVPLARAAEPVTPSGRTFAVPTVIDATGFESNPIAEVVDPTQPEPDPVVTLEMAGEAQPVARRSRNAERDAQSATNLESYDAVDLQMPRKVRPMAEELAPYQVDAVQGAAWNQDDTDDSGWVVVTGGEADYYAQEPLPLDDAAEAFEAEVVNPPATMGYYGDYDAVYESALCDSCGGCGACSSCCEQFVPLVDIRPQFLIWWIKGVDTPPLVTTGPQTQAQNQAGVIGQPGTSVLFGNDRLVDEQHYGGRISGTWWLDPCATIGAEFDYFGLGEQTDEFWASSNGNPIYARPFINAQNNQNASELVAYPGIIQGTVHARSSTELQSAAGAVRIGMARQPCFWTDVILGYRYARLDDDVAVSESLTSVATGTPIAIGTTFAIHDHFMARNDFHGGELGFSARMQRGAWSLDLLSKFGIGLVHQEMRIRGYTVTTVPGGGSSTANGGLLALPSNIGDHEDDRFSYLQEVNATIGYQVNCNLRLTAGYTFMYWDNVLRSGDHIDPVIDPTQLPPNGNNGQTRPQFRFTPTDFWAQGINLGAIYTF